jgi:hypothetical protein
MDRSATPIRSRRAADEICLFVAEDWERDVKFDQWMPTASPITTADNEGRISRRQSSPVFRLGELGGNR